jgi:hypothetical protein
MNWPAGKVKKGIANDLDSYLDTGWCVFLDRINQRLVRGVAAVIVASLIKMALAWGLVFLGDFGASWIKHEGKFFSFLKWIPAPLAAYITWFIFGAPEL